MSRPLLVCLFHLNLAYSSLEEEARARVVEACYRPLLALPERTGFPVAIEATGWTLERIAELDPGWLAEARELIAGGRLELVGSGHSQCAAPLLPAEVNASNLELGLDDYERLLGVRPRLALVCEQAYAPGLVELYAEAGFAGIVADWDNAYRSHPEWPPATRRFPQLAAGGTARLPVIWSDSIAFQRFQRFAHGELPLERWLDWIGERVGGGPGAQLLYANDAEVFDRRPGRFAAEPSPGSGEWDRIAAGLRAVVERGTGTPALPSQVLDLLDAPEGGRELRLESAAHPVPVKKQDKYNIARWAVTGRDDQDLNTRCRRLYAAGTADRRELCELWASDFRTHITERRWAKAQERLAAAERRAAVTARPPLAPPDGPPPGDVERDGALLRIRRGTLDVVLNARRGLAVSAFTDTAVHDAPLCGTLEQGYFPTIELGADWYTGHAVQETPAHYKVTDLEPAEPGFAELSGGALRVGATIATRLGPVEKTLTVDPQAGALDIEHAFRWPELPPGTLRAGHVTLVPEAFDAATLWYGSHNGGRELEVHALGADGFDHGRAVSGLVSCGQGLGITEGVVLVGDAERHMRIEVDTGVSTPLGLVTFQPAGDRFFLRVTLSLAEHDDTRRGPIARADDAPQRLRMRLYAASSRTASTTAAWSASLSAGKHGSDRQPA
jgi:hypothetical protein